MLTTTTIQEDAQDAVNFGWGSFSAIVFDSGLLVFLTVIVVVTGVIALGMVVIRNVFPGR